VVTVILAPVRPGIIFTAMHRTLSGLLLFVLATGGRARAESNEYTVLVREGLPATFEVPFSVPYAGLVVIDAEWKGTRLLFFGVEGPGGVEIARRSGPSPQRLDVTVEDARVAAGTRWKLTVKALAARGEAEGTVRISVPDAPEVVARREAERHPPPPPPPPPPAWAVPAAMPEGTPPEIARVFAGLESYRSAVWPPDGGPPDACGWQQDFLRFATTARERLGDSGAARDVPTFRYFGRMGAAVRSVEELRASRDPLLAGPVPADPVERRTWLVERKELIRPIERALDELTELLRGGHAPALEDERWVPRLNACLTACERFFDARVRLGDAPSAPNRELAEAQWDRIRAAGRVLDALAALAPPP